MNFNLQLSIKNIDKKYKCIWLGSNQRCLYEKQIMSLMPSTTWLQMLMDQIDGVGGIWTHVHLTNDVNLPATKNNNGIRY